MEKPTHETRSIKIHASVPNGLLQHYYVEHGEKGLWKYADQILSGFSEIQILKIAKGEAFIVGNTVDGISYKENN